MFKTKAFWCGVVVGLTAIGWAWAIAIVVTQTVVRRLEYTVQAPSSASIPVPGRPTRSMFPTKKK